MRAIAEPRFSHAIPPDMSYEMFMGMKERRHIRERLAGVQLECSGYPFTSMPVTGGTRWEGEECAGMQQGTASITTWR